ncbi:MAG: hypothetical protein KDC34_04980 [Saprospiraceae bacterium]|nr:hypothetical protein [Saprospiraceae bacterium]
MRIKSALWFFLFILLLGSKGLYAQGPPSGDGPPSGTNTPNSPLDVVVDTSIYFFLYATDPGKYYPIEDTLLGDYFSQYDPIRKGETDKAHLGTPGSPHRDLFFQPQDFRGVTLGINQFDANRITPEKMRFYRVQQAYSRMGFSQGSSQEETMFDLEFGRSFDKGLSMSINYSRMNNMGAYDHQRAIDNAFGFGLWYQSKRGRYESFFSYTTNSETLEENGGISDDLRVLNNFGDSVLVEPAGVPTYLSDAMSRYDQSFYSYEQYLYFFAPRDTSGNLRPASVGLTHRIQYITEGQKFYDADLEETEVEEYYQGLAIDSRGLRNFSRLNTFENTVDLFIITQRPAADKEAPPIRRSFLRAGLVYDLHTLKQEPLEENLNNLFLRGRWDFTPGPAFQASAYAHLGFLSNIGDFRLSGKLATALADWFQLEGQAVFQQRSPTLLENRMFISQQEIWNESFRKHTETRIEGRLVVPKTKSAVSIAWNLTDGYVYFDTLGYPRQLGSALNILQFRVDQSVKVWKLYLDNQVLLQSGTNNELRLPAYYSKHSFYFMGNLFKEAMFARIGFDLRLIGPHTPVTYQPLTGQFIQQTSRTLDWQPLIDAFITFKVDKFRFFFRLENILPVLTQDYNFLISDYPIRSMGLRFGISWQFVE